MAAPMSVFLSTGMDLETMVAAIERVLGVKLVRIDEDGLTRHEHSGVGYTMVLMKDHGLEDDRGIPFSAYDYEMDFLVSRAGARAEDADNLKHWLATYSFGKLSAALGCRAMLVHDLQEVVERAG